jgi:serine/threonine-protein kinase
LPRKGRARNLLLLRAAAPNAMITPASEATPGPTGTSLVGQVVSGRYRIDELLGEGGMGAVYLAEHTHMRKRVALKLLHAEMSKDKEVLARFRREAEAAAHVEHPNVVAATDFGQTEDGSFFLVLEYVEGTRLRDAMAAGPMPPTRALHVARQIGLALERAHQAGIVHRDLKPENVMLVRKDDDPDFVKVLDFGIAKVEAHPTRDASQPLTRIGTILGTPEYMAPEQALGEAVGPGADLYAVGIMLYEMLTSMHPFHAEDRMAVLSMHIVAPVPPMTDRNPAVDIPPLVEELVRKLLEKDAKLRPAGARALVDAIDVAAAQSGVSLPALPFSRSFGRESSPDVSRGPSPPPSSVREAPPTSGHMPAGPWQARDALAKTDYGTPASIPNLNVRTAPSFERRIEEAVAKLKALPVEKAVAKLKALPRPWLYAATAIVPLMVGLVSVTLLLGHRGSPNDETDGAVHTGPVDSKGSAPTKRVPRAAAEKLSVASAQGPAALEKLASEFPDDVAVQQHLIRAFIDAGRNTDALRAVRALAKVDRDAVDEETVQFVAGATARLDTHEDAFSLLEGPLGPRGIDALIDLSTNKAFSLAVRNRATRSLSHADVKANASPGAAILLDLKAASGCAAKRDVVERAKDSGDARCLATLKSMRNPRGCGFMGIKDCYPCLRKDDVLDDSIRAVEARSSK